MFFLVERDYYKGDYCCLKDTPIQGRSQEF